MSETEPMSVDIKAAMELAHEIKVYSGENLCDLCLAEDVVERLANALIALHDQREAVKKLPRVFDAKAALYVDQRARSTNAEDR